MCGIRPVALLCLYSIRRSLPPSWRGSDRALAARRSGKTRSVLDLRSLGFVSTDIFGTDAPGPWESPLRFSPSSLTFILRFSRICCRPFPRHHQIRRHPQIWRSLTSPPQPKIPSPHLRVVGISRLFRFINTLPQLPLTRGCSLVLISLAFPKATLAPCISGTTV